MEIKAHRKNNLEPSFPHSKPYAIILAILTRRK
ncbi:hypothetical protein [Coxiella burnetii]|uniref:Uncharacterized protein n=1 Tax=Coxiella burnetii (strain Dugway 5J108-111) TaxID=434922 RepID=B5XHD0_COXBN|nr:hypothetical protein [Coxiella burnetii]ACI23150.1 hypothetical protein CBUD_1230a [Coxiella burnetii Dugway 5J108-111]ACJ20209.1 hypothetical protein CbuK_0999 [Coxiella burnetii CbuK_Q154]APQ67044.1 hypothetical protein A35_05055 [Coxiella burnetii 'MSU Goat Q177']ATN85860.1 hypothetical protein AYO29_05030 [Coxiella burnetii str. Schperling]OYK80006.1 hypothetical protein CbuD7E6568_06285 [Coxiella burnetii]